MICSKIQIDSLSNTVVLFIDCESAVRAITRLPPCTGAPEVPTRGLRTEGPVENFTVAVPAVTPADLPARIDGPVLVAVKAHHTAAAAALLAGRLHGDAFTVALQNGLTGGILAGAVGPGR